ncbi:glutamic acid-rich protein-like [Phymastichus coffea]|uniref:glutamic acid-rich protein-like n=1 Tax=Phymastichus coffea TaxID=108790 RepID=UPI00273BE9BE|nr:glutamic acid-rich protein-like [Phymastichus coffea]
MEGDSGMSDVGETTAHAAVRFYADNAEVNFLPVTHIQHYDPKEKKFPYDAKVKSGKGAEGQDMFEPAVILEIAADKETLQAKKRRWPKPNKRLSTVLHELAQKHQDQEVNGKEKAKGKGKAKKGIFSTTSSNKDQKLPSPLSVADAETAMGSKLKMLQSNLEFNEATTTKEFEKDKRIMELEEQLKALQKKMQGQSNNSSNYSPSISASPSMNDIYTPQSARYSRTNPLLPCNIILKDVLDTSYSSNVNFRLSPANKVSTSKALESRPSTSGIQKQSLKEKDIGKDAVPKNKLKISSQKRAVAEKRRNIRKEPDKKPKNKKYKKKLKSVLYDSDDYIQSDCEIKRRRLTTWEEEATEDKPARTMFHLHFGVSVPYKAWKKAKRVKSAYKFLRELIPYIWETDEFLCLAIQINRTKDASNRSPVDPKKFEALKRGYVQYLIENKIIHNEMSSQKKRAIIQQFGRKLGTIIAQERQTYSTCSDELREEKYNKNVNESDDNEDEDEDENHDEDQNEDDEENNDNDDSEINEDDLEYD